MSDGRSTTDVNQGQAPKETTIIELLRSMGSVNDSHTSRRAADMPWTRGGAALNTLTAYNLRCCSGTTTL